MSLLAEGFETFTMYVPVSAWTTKKAPDPTDEHYVRVLLVPDSGQKPGVIAPPRGWRATHIVATFVDGDGDWLEIWSDAPENQGRRIAGRQAPSAADIAIPLAEFPELYLLVKGGSTPSTVFLSLARPAPCPLES